MTQAQEIGREDTEQGTFYVRGSERWGPFSGEEMAKPTFVHDLSLRMDVNAKVIIAIDIKCPPKHLRFSNDTKAVQIANQLLEICRERIATLNDTSEILVYNEDKGVFETGGEGLLAALMELAAHESSHDEVITINVVREVIERVRRRTRTSRKAFDADPFKLNLANGILDLTAYPFALQPHTPKFKSMVQLPVNFDPSEDCPKIKKFLQQVIYVEDWHCLQEYCGYTLWKDLPNAKMLMLYGEGCNGKSTFVNLIKALLGGDNVAARSLQDLGTNRFAVADLYGKMANLYSDLEDRALRSTGLLKMLTGRDTIAAEHKFKPSFTFVNYAKPIFSANKVPQVFEDTVAFWRRWIIIKFPRIFEGDKENHNLLQQLTTPEELSGFLNFALEGLTRLRKTNWFFSNSKSIEEVRREYIRNSSPVQAFILDCTEPDSTNSIPKDDLYGYFKDYCLGHKLPILRRDPFFKQLQDFAKITTERLTKAEKRVWSVAGLKVRDKGEWGKEEDSQQKLDGILSEEKGGQPGQGGQSSEDGEDVQPVQPVQPPSNLSESKVTEEVIEEAVSLLREKLPLLRLQSHSEVLGFLAERYGDSEATVLLECLESRIRANPEGLLELT